MENAGQSYDPSRRSLIKGLLLSPWLIRRVLKESLANKAPIQTLNRLHEKIPLNLDNS